MRRKSKRRKGFSLIGASAPQSLSNYLYLYIIAKGITKSNVILGCLNKWKCDTQKDLSDEKLLNEIVNRLVVQWRAEKSVNSDLNFDTYILRVKIELKSKNIPKETIDLIIKNITCSVVQKK